MPGRDLDIITSHLAPRKKDDFLAAVKALETGLEAGEIKNADFVRSKESINRALDYAWRRSVVNPYIYNRDYRSSLTPEESADLSKIDGYIQPNSINRMLRDAQKLNPSDAKKRIVRFLEASQEIMQQVQDCKKIAVKRAPAAKPPSVVETYKAPGAARSTVSRVIEELERITAASKTSLAEAIRSSTDKRVSAFLDASRDPGLRKTYSAYDYVNSSKTGTPQIALPVLRHLTVKDDRPGSPPGGHVHHPDYDKRIASMAQERAEDLCRSFVEKNAAKLAPILDAKSDLETCEVVGGSVNLAGFNGRLRFRFRDGARFDAQTSSVLSYSVYGTPFMRFPLTFHDAQLGNGERLTNLSEKKMNECFARAGDDSSPAL